MGHAIAFSALLITTAVVAVTLLRRGRTGRDDSRLDAEAEANRWLIRLGGSLMPPGTTGWVAAGETAGRALTEAAECHRTARTQLTEARTTAQYEQATRTAQEGLRHVRTAREALGLEMTA
ncbi:hypothetical protein [Streptomyces sp. NPDC001759]